MKKAIQKQVNREVEAYVFRYSYRALHQFGSERLRNCNAVVIFLEDILTGEVIFALQSYDTIVAVIDGREAYDFLRYVYGYTATSAQHIAKFFHDYAWERGNRASLIEHTWRPV